MDSISFRKVTKDMPSVSGVYFFIGKRKKILYIGKATSLKTRVKSYFDNNLREKRSALIEKMVEEAVTIEWVKTDSVLEALLLETNLIRTHKPTYNTRSKDDKSYNHVIITKEEYPRVLVIRGKDLASSREEYAKIFGPFPSGALFKDALKLIRKLFQFYDTEKPVYSLKSKMQKGKIDFNKQIGLYPKDVSPKEYKRTIRHIAYFFEGKKKKIIAELEREMMRYAKNEQFEKAEEIRKKLFGLKHIQDVSLLKDESREYKDDRIFRIEAYDVAHIGGEHMVGAMTVVENGKANTSEYKKFTIRDCKSPDDPRALREILTRRMKHSEWKLPDLIVVDGNAIQRNVALKITRELGVPIPVVGVVKDSHHKPNRIIGDEKIVEEHKREILLANTEAHRFSLSFHRQKRSKSIFK